MSASERRKGQRGQLAVRRLFEAHGWDVTQTGAGLTACDLLAMRGGVTLAIECKNQAVLRLPLWRRQTLANAPEGTVPVLVYRRSHLWLVECWDGARWSAPWDAAAFAKVRPGLTSAAAWVAA